MQQLLEPLSVLSFAIGIAAFVLCLLHHQAVHARLSRCMAILQGLVAYSSFYFFAVVNLRFAVYGSETVLVAWHVAGQVWSGFFCYYYCLFFFLLTGTALPERGRKLLLGICFIFASSLVAPFLLGAGGDSLLARIDYQNSFIVLPVDLAAVLFASVVELAALRRVGGGLKVLLRIDLCIKAVVIPATIAAILLEAALPDFWDLAKFACVHLYLFAWNVVVAASAARIARPSGLAALARSGGQPARRAASGAPGRGPGGEESSAELEKLRRAMEEGKAYLDPDLTLTALADKLGMPRNRLSRLINETIGKSYNDFINGYRVKESKALLESADPGMDVLGVAFESGFNSKATFYAAFKRMTGMTPSEYRASPASLER